MRGVAILMVIIAHFPLIAGATTFNSLMFVAKKSGFGYVGVEIFFVLSSYLITKIFLHHLRRNDNYLLQIFYIKRLFRLAPVALIAITACAVIMPNYDYFYQLVFVSNYYFAYDQSPHPLRHFWSLAVEDQFYVFWPLVLISCVVESKRLKVILLCLIVISVGSILVRDVVMSTTDARNLIYRSLESRMLSLTIGGAFAIYGLPKVNTIWLFVTAAVSLAIAGCAMFADKAGIYMPLATIKAVCYLAFALCLFLLSMRDGVIASILSYKPLVYVGMISYGLYVYHEPILFYFQISHMQPLSAQAPGHLVVKASVVIILSTLISWYLIEKPLMALRNKIVTSRSSLQKIVVA